MKSFIKFGNLSSNAVQRTIVFLGMLLVFFFVVYFVGKYSTMEGMAGMSLGSSPPYVQPPPPPPSNPPPPPTPPTPPSPAPATSSPIVATPPSSNQITGSTTQNIQIVL